MKYFLLSIFTFLHLSAFDAFVSPKILKESLADKELVILDIASKDIYKTSHILNAIHVDITKFINQENSLQVMNTQAILQKALQDLGINSSSKIVIYSRNTEKSILNSSYLALVLISNGFESVSLLDGGYMAWVFENELLVSSRPSYAPNSGNIQLKQKNIIVTSLAIKNSTKNTRILDARTPMEYYATLKSESINALGHIPTAKSSYYNDKFLKDNTLRTSQELQEIYIAGHELKRSHEIIVYADNVFRASMEWFILYKVMDFKNTKIYEASLLEWSNNLSYSLKKFKWE